MPTPTNDASTTPQGRRLALVIGVNDTCSDILPSLDYPIADAKAIADVLEQKGDFTKVTLLREDASSAKVKKAVLDLTRNRNDNDFLLLYFSGHGQQAYDEMRTEIRNTYLGTSDFNEQDVEDDAHIHVSMHWLRDHLFEKTNAKRVLIILDCCYAEDIRTGLDHNFNELRKQIQYYFDIPGAEVNKRQAGCYIAIAAAGYDTPADEREESVTLTRLLLKALHGEELALFDDKGQLTLDRLITYIKHEMPKIQKPVISSSDSIGQEYVLVSYPELVSPIGEPSHGFVIKRPTTYIPFLRDPLFQERPGEFARLEQLLLPSSPITQRQPVRVGLVGVTGMGGIGKTQLVVEFSYRYQKHFPSGIFWMSATGNDVLEWQAEFAKLAFNTGYLPPDKDLSPSENESKRARHICRYLASHSDALLILDNVEQPELVTSALPALAGGDVACSIVYTSRNTTNTPSQVTLYEVERLPEIAALHLLLSTTHPEVYTDFVAKSESVEVLAAKQVCLRVGYLPLALVHLRGRLQQDKRATLIRLASVLNQGKLTSLKQVLFETFRLSWEHVRDEESRRLFQLACYFPEATPISLWLHGLAAGLGEDAESFGSLGDACLHLQEVSLFEEFEGEQVHLHPLVREFGQMLLAEEQAKGSNLIANATKLLVSAFTNLNSLEKRVHSKGYQMFLKEVRSARDYLSVLGNGQTTLLEQVERWLDLDRESYLLAEETRVSGFFYQQLYNHSVEEGKKLFTGNAPIQWLEQINPVEIEDQAHIHIFAGHTDEVTSVAFSKDGRYVLTGSSDSTARLWECSSEQTLHTFKGHIGYVTSVAFSPDRRYVLTGSNDNTARLWECNGGQALHTFEGHAREVTSIAFSEDGRYVLTGSWDSTARLWECNSGRHLRTFEGHTGVVRSVAFSEDGRYVLTGSSDSTARLWECNSGRHLRTFEGHTGVVRSVAFSPNGRLIATCDHNGRVYLWIAQGPDGGRLVAMYKAAYEVGAVFWEDAAHIVLADKGGARGRPNIYRLRLHGLE